MDLITKLTQNISSQNALQFVNRCTMITRFVGIVSYKYAIKQVISVSHVVRILYTMIHDYLYYIIVIYPLLLLFYPTVVIFVNHGLPYINKV